ncbi:1-(5-phosphoribosyl)-5-[(5- phosphoribosylamino)methylideneamino] imidazole-4-carboxamide isomerase [Candida maltosa Xu316]|uniref:1-(5-phosphoribosyl)-5-[(5-phosphoribosylamino)methylideneamino] imidazole-4-carboxamide isomerase n=1 Tax=Candida maltosa (strain Xu316) TaxID=1245528 RepID=M3JU09_CANMX|nr:1-(5-phosphoribosyl)-5-[(5- phosphoribosylamino)methylideneamino] imidazole-4-carboxamide isomerase [Candida maltosa Xu316]
MTKFRGCIDIHSGQVKQIVGGTLTQDDTTETTTTTENFVSTKPSSYYAELYKDNNIQGCHVIKLGSNPINDETAKLALKTWPGNLQIGGGINIDNAKQWLEYGASHVILTSWLFTENNEGKMELDFGKLEKVSQLIGKDNLIVDLSCRTIIDDEDGEPQWYVAMNKWQTITVNKLSAEFLLEVYVRGLMKN